MPFQFLIPLIIVFDLLLAATVVGLIVRSSWKPLEVFFPAQVPSDTSYGRKFQSFSFGLVNYGFSIHVVIDDEFLHLTPIWIVSQFGLKPISIPWEAIEPLPTTKSAIRTLRVKIRKQTVIGPKWCFELIAMPPQAQVQQ